jgi:hypothetical protein
MDRLTGTEAAEIAGLLSAVSGQLQGTLDDRDDEIERLCIVKQRHIDITAFEGC